MKILKIWDADYPWDIRVEKICRTLSQESYEVHLLCRNLKNLPTYEKWQYGHIHRLPFFLTRSVNYLLSFPAFFNPLWIFSARKLIKKFDIDLILVRDLPLTLAAVAAGRMTGRPVIWDMAENYSFLVDDIWRYEPFRFQNFFIRNPYIVRLIEKVALKLVDHILVVVEESQKRLLASGVEQYRVSIVSNTPDLSAFEKESEDLSESDKNIFKNRFVVIYVGGLEVSRGLEQVVDAMPFVINNAPDILFLIIGAGNSEERIKTKVRELGISGHVLLLGWLDFDLVLPFIQRSDIGIIPHCVTAHTNHTIPNKFFDFMSQGLPVITSAAKPMIRILREERCGLTFQGQHELIEALITLHDNNVRKIMGAKGQSAVIRYYNWKHDFASLSKIIDCYCNIQRRG
jgi:glycosyltransferase involved in cell wall biosynthesis